MSRARKNPRLRQQPGANSESHSSIKEMPPRSKPGRKKNQAGRKTKRAAKIYSLDEVRSTAPEDDLRQEDYQSRIRRALWIHRWLPAPDGKRLAQLKGGGSSWPTPAPDWQQYGWDGKGPRPWFSPSEISDHDRIFGLPSWFRGLSKRSFNILWQRDALKWTFQKIGNKYGVSRQRAHTVYKQALKAVITEAVRGDHEI